MSELYRTVEGDMMDLISERFYGDESGVIRIYDVNPGLSALGPKLPAGRIVVIPDPEPVIASAAKIRLWG